MLFEKYKIKQYIVKNRIVMAPMCMYQSDNCGFVKEFHKAHYYSRSLGGVGIVIVEATSVSENGRISDRDLGIWREEHVDGLSQLASNIKEAGAIPFIQLNHAGRKSFSKKVIAPIDKLFTYKPGEFCIIQDFNRYVVKNYNKFNSSIFRLDTHKATHKNVYEDFIKDPKIPITRYHGDQDWIRKCIQKDYNYWPEDWIQSYKWEMRGKPKFNGRPRGERDFLEQAEPVVKAGTAIAVFHGDPNPHNCKDPWVLENWQ
jgi:hypothetical protein